MTHISSNYAAKLAIAGELAKMDARAVTISAVAKIKPADARAKYKQMQGTQSRSGQTPTDHQWFLLNQSRRQHGALLLLTYAKYREEFEPHPDAHGLAFVFAFRMYVQVLRVPADQAPVSPERFNLLVGKGFEIGWRDITKAGSSKFAADNVKVMQCKACRTHHLVESHFINYRCQSCAN